MQVGAGYLVNPVFHASYLKYAEQKEDYSESESFRMNYPDISLRQARVDRTYLYGVLISSNKNDGERKFIIKYEAGQGKILAWIEFLKDYDYNGSQEIRIIKLESRISTKYRLRYTEGFLKYLDTIQADLNGLNILLPGHYSDSHKKEFC